MNSTQAIQAIIQKVPRFWQDRALDIFRHMAPSITTVSNLRISSDWPLSGSISFTRDADGKRVRIWLTKKTKVFKASAK